MRTQSSSKILLQQIRSRSSEGFTLIELLVVIVIIGLLSAIALPSFLNQANKAKQTEAKLYISSMNRAQQAYYLEQTSFADQVSFGKLGLGISTQHRNYQYRIVSAGTIVTNQAQLLSAASPLKAYIGGVKIGSTQHSDETVTLTSLCEGEQPPSLGGVNGNQSVRPGGAKSPPKCPQDYTSISE